MWLMFLKPVDSESITSLKVSSAGREPYVLRAAKPKK